MTEQQKPSVHDWPAMAKDLIERALQSPNYGNADNLTAAGCFAREGMPPIIVTCTLDVHQQNFKVLHIAISLKGQRGVLPPNEIIKEISGLFDKNPPYTYQSTSGLFHCLWPFPWTDKETLTTLNYVVVQNSRILISL